MTHRPCTKHGYRDEVEAGIALAGILKKTTPGRAKIEQRAYACGNCGSWHLTSMPASVEITTKGRWVADTYKAARAEGMTSHEATHEVNRVLYGKASCPDCEVDQ